MDSDIDAGVRRATDSDMASAGLLLHRFNDEFSELTPGPETLAERLRQLHSAGDTVVLLAGRDPVGIAVLRFRGAIWSGGLECYLAELYVTPDRRGQGIGRELMEAALSMAKAHGADTMDIGVDAPDLVARRLYESLGFTNRVGGSGEALMYLYERDL